jgi:hypothetical protein
MCSVATVDVYPLYGWFAFATFRLRGTPVLSRLAESKVSTATWLTLDAVEKFIIDYK